MRAAACIVTFSILNLPRYHAIRNRPRCETFSRFQDECKLRQHVSTALDLQKYNERMHACIKAC